MSYLTQKQIEQLKEAFMVFDKDNSGNVSKNVIMVVCQEFYSALLSLGIELDEQTLQNLILKVDTNKDGLISFNQFIGLVAEKFREPENELEFLQVFKVLDKDGDGRLSKVELQNVIQLYRIPLQTNELDLLFEQGDQNHFGYITYEEYLRIMKCL